MTKKCFVITPIGDETDPIRRHIDGIIDAAITPALGENYQIVVSHKISEPGSITKQIISEIYRDELVVANLTNKNPNVMYELAFRHSLGLPVIMIAERGTALPSDIIMQRTIFYQNDAKGVLELREELKKAEEEISFEEKCGPIVEILCDLSYDTKVLQHAQGSNTSTEPLEYILRKLNRIEDAITVSSSRNSNSRKSVDYPSLLMGRFEYQELKNRLSENKLTESLREISLKVDPDAFIDEVVVNKTEKTIIIYIIINAPVLEAEIHEYILKILSEYGFVGLKTVYFK